MAHANGCLCATWPQVRRDMQEWTDRSRQISPTAAAENAERVLAVWRCLVAPP